MTPPKGFSEQRLISLSDHAKGAKAGVWVHFVDPAVMLELVAEVRRQAALLTRAAILIQCHVGADPDSFSAWMEDYEKGVEV